MVQLLLSSFQRGNKTRALPRTISERDSVECVWASSGTPELCALVLQSVAYPYPSEHTAEVADLLSTLVRLVHVAL